RVDDPLAEAAHDFGAADERVVVVDGGGACSPSRGGCGVVGKAGGDGLVPPGGFVLGGPRGFPPVGEEFFVGEEHEHGDDHFGGGDAAVVSGPAGGVADAFVPGDDDAAASGEHSVAGDEDFPVVGGAGAVAGGFPVTGFAVFVAVPHVAVVGDEDDGPVGAVRGVEEGAEFPDAVDPPGRGVAFPAGGGGVVDAVAVDGDDLFGVVDGRLDVGGQPVPGAGREFPLLEEGAGAGSGGGFPPEGGESGAFVALPA